MAPRCIVCGERSNEKDELKPLPAVFIASPQKYLHIMFCAAMSPMIPRDQPCLFVNGRLVSGEWKPPCLHPPPLPASRLAPVPGLLVCSYFCRFQASIWAIRGGLCYTNADPARQLQVSVFFSPPSATRRKFVLVSKRRLFFLFFPPCDITSVSVICPRHSFCHHHDHHHLGGGHESQKLFRIPPGLRRQSDFRN